MAARAISRPAGAIQRRSPPPHDAWQRDLYTGVLSLRLEIPAGQYVSPATGRLGLVTSGSDEVVAQRAATSAGVLVVPGSGIKGAVRTIYELLSFSCDPFARAGCTPQWCCDACAVFGLPGYSGRLGFSDAAPSEAGKVTVEVQKVPVPWKPDPSKTLGDFRLYDLQEATCFEKGRPTPQPRPKELSREVYLGTFEARMTFSNLEAQELGRVLLAMGIGTDRATRFLLRLGGVKYDGKGAVKVAPRSVRLVQPKARTYAGDACGEEYVRWIAAARGSAWAEAFWPKLEELAAILYPRS